MLEKTFQVVYALSAALLFLASYLGTRLLLVRRGGQLMAAARREAEQILGRARASAGAVLEAARREALEAAEKRRQSLALELSERDEFIHKLSERIDRRRHTLARAEELGRMRAELLAARETALSLLQGRKQAADAQKASARKQARDTLTRIADETHAEARERLVQEWIEEARAEAKEELRQVDQGSGDPEYVRSARRLLDIASQRYQGHYLTERLLSNISLAPGVGRRLAGPDRENLGIISEVANVKLSLSDDEGSIRLEGQDSFGREIARRAISRFTKNMPRGGKAALKQAVLAIAEELDREAMELGKRAFRELEIPRAHPEIVRLVGRLNYRTSYTQNQWKHAIEAAFLCGMIASEMRLDVKIARRAALLHDIGKALTHEIDGSHAVIGADYARRLGESEIVANAIGAHHTDEPWGSPYALIVAAADAMSGARPGARHEQADSYVQRVAELERICGSLEGVDRVHAVQAGREVRVYVKEGQVSDLRAAEMSSEIAEKISENLVFPGQIKVTVIREVTASAVAS